MHSSSFHRTATAPGLIPSRIAEVIVTRLDGTRHRGSGYRVTATTVLTAAHTIGQGNVVEVRFDAGQETEWTAFAEPRWFDESTDLAVLAFDSGSWQVIDGTAPQYGRLADEHAIVDVYTAGFPLWKARTPPGRKAYRELHDAHGKLSVLSNRRSRTLEITVEPPREDPDPNVSPWEGMSGAAVWAGGAIIGVVIEHHRAESTGRLTATRIDRCLELAGPRRIELANLLGIAGDPAELVEIPPQPSVTQQMEIKNVRYPPKSRLPQRADSYQVRPEQLVLEEILGTGRATAFAQGSTLATGVLTGTGGVGKTQIARAYADKAWDDPTLAVAAWIDASSKQEIENGYAAVARKITGRSGQEPEQAVDDLMDWLGTSDRCWLIVFDGLHDPQDLVGLWPPDTPNGRLVITTRDQAFSLWNGTRDLIPLQEFSEAQSEAYLSDRLRTNPRLLDGAADLADTLGHLPLALDHAAAVMLFRQWTAETYRIRFLDETKKLVEIVPRPHELMPSDKYRDTIATTWQISINQADSQPPERVAGQLLALASVLNPNGIPVSLFSAPAALGHLNGVLQQPVTAENTHDGLALLDRFSLVTAPDLNSPLATVSVHLLVQRATRADLPPHKLGEIAKIAADALDEMWPDDETRADTDTLEILHSNAAALDKVAGAHLINPDEGCHAVLVRVGQSLGRLGRKHAARTYFLQIVARTARAPGEDNPHTLQIRRHAASALGYTRDHKGAFDEFDALYKDYLRIAGDRHIGTVDARASRASYQALTGDVAGAVTELESVLQARQDLHRDPFHVDTLTTRARLAKWRAHLGHTAQAIEELENLLLDYKKRRPQETRAIFLTRATLATLRGHAGNAAAAAAELRDLLEDQTRAYGPGQHTINTRISLVHWYRTARNWPAAKEARRELVAEQDQLLRDFEERYGHKHPDTLAWRAALMAVHPIRRDRLAEAVAAQRTLVADQEEALSPWHPATLGSRLKLASLIGGSGDTAAAVLELQDVLDLGTQRHGLTHPLIVRTLARLASWQARAGDPAEAVRTLQIVLARQRLASAPTAHITTTLANLAMHHQAAGNWLCVGETLCILLAHLRSTLQPDHPDVLRTRLRIALWRAESGDADSAVNALRQVTHDYTTSLSGVHRDTMAARLELARWLWEFGHHDEAQKTLIALVADQRTRLGGHDRRTLANEKTLQSWRQDRYKTSTGKPARPRRGSRHYRKPRAKIVSLPTPRTQTADVAFGAHESERLTELISGSRAWTALLEALALAVEPGLPRHVWIVVANTLSATELIDTGEIDQLLAEAGAYITTEVSDGVPAYRLSNLMIIRKVLSLAAQRTGLADELDTRLRNRQVTETLIIEFPLDSYVFKNLPHHAAAGDWLHHLAWNPAILDYIDLETLTAEVLKAGFGNAELPNEFAGALQVRHLLKGLAPADRAVVRGMVTTRSSRANQRFAGRRKPRHLVDTPIPTWTLAWARQSRDPHHITLVGRPTRSRLRERDDEITALALATCDGAEALAIGYRSGTASLIDITTGRELPTTIKIGDGLIALDAIPISEAALLTVVGKATVQAWSFLDDGWRGGPVTTFDDGVRAAAVISHPNAGSILAVVEGGGHIVLFDPCTSSIVDRSTARHDHQVNSVCGLPPHDKSRACFAVAGDDGRVTIWNSDPLQPTGVIVSGHKGPVTSLAAIHAGESTLLCTGGKDGRIGFWDPHNRRQVHPGFVRAHRGAVLALTPIAQGGKQANLASGGEDDVVRLWSIATGQRIGAQLTGHTARVQALATPTLPSGHRVIASSGHDGSVRIWDLQDAWQLDRARNSDKTHRPKALADDSGGAVTAVTSARLGHEQELRLVVGRRNGTIQRHDPDNSALVGEPIQAHMSAVRTMTALSLPDGSYHVATVGADNCIKVWDFASTHPVAELRPSGKGEVRVITAIHRKGRDPLLAIGDSDGSVRLWSPGGRNDVRYINAHTQPITSMVSVELDYRTTRLVTGGADFRIRFWDPDTGQHDDGPEIDKNCGPIYAMALLPSPNGPILAASGHENRGTIRLYQLPERDALQGLNIRTGDILMNTMAGVGTAYDYSLLVGVGRKSAIRVWRPDTPELIHRLDVEGPILASHVFGTRLALSTKRGLYQLHLTAAERTDSGHADIVTQEPV